MDCPASPLRAFPLPSSGLRVRVSLPSRSSRFEFNGSEGKCLPRHARARRRCGGSAAWQGWPTGGDRQTARRSVPKGATPLPSSSFLTEQGSEPAQVTANSRKAKESAPWASDGTALFGRIAIGGSVTVELWLPERDRLIHHSLLKTFDVFQVWYRQGWRERRSRSRQD